MLSRLSQQVQKLWHKLQQHLLTQPISPRPSKRRQRGAVAVEALEQRVLLSATITPISETNSGTDWRDPVPVINDRGTVVFADHRWIFTTSQFSWMTNDRAVLPGLTSGYGGGPKSTPYGTDHFPPDLNNSDILVLIQYVDAANTEQELVVYDVRNQQRLQTITTEGEFKYFREIEINDAGQISVIAEQDDGTGGLYSLSTGSSVLQPVLVRSGLGAKLDDLKLLDDGRAVFRVDGSDRYIVAPGGQPELFANSGYFGDLGVSLYSASRQINAGQVRFEVRFSPSGDSSLWAASPIPLRLTIGKITSGGQTEVYNELINYSGQSSLYFTTSEPTEIPDDLAGYIVEIQYEGDPWQVPLVDVNPEPVILSRSSNYSSSIDRIYSDEIDEPSTGESAFDISFSKSSAGGYQQVVTGTYQVIRLGSTTNQDVADANGSFTIPAGQWSTTVPITLLADDSSILTNMDHARFVVLYTLHNTVNGNDYGPYLDYYEIKDADYLPMATPLRYGVPAAINGQGDFAYYVSRASGLEADRLVLVSNNQVLLSYTEQSGDWLIDPVVLSNQKDLIFYGKVSNLYGFYRLTPSGPELVVEDDGLLTNAPHYASDLDDDPYNFSVSANGNFVFFSEYQTSLISPGPTDGYGVYAIIQQSGSLPDLEVTSLSYKVAPKTNMQKGGPIPRGSKIRVNANVVNLGAGDGRPVGVDLYFRTDDGEEIWLGTIATLDGIKAGQRISFTKREVTLLADLPAGAGELIARVDHQRSIEESNERNNDSTPTAIQIGALAPGIYLAARELSLPVANPGRHQFVVLVPKKSNSNTIQMSDGTYVTVLAAYNRNETLTADKNHNDDVDPLREYFDPDLHGDEGSHWNTIVKPSLVPLKSLNKSTKGLLAAFETYQQESQRNPITYPSLGEHANAADLWIEFDIKAGPETPGFTNVLNSNSWAQSLCTYVLGPGMVDGHMAGLDVFYWNRIPSQYFVRKLRHGDGVIITGGPIPI